MEIESTLISDNQNFKKTDITKLRYYNEKGLKQYDIERIQIHLESRDGSGMIRDI